MFFKHKKAQNLIEVSLLALVVLITSIYVIGLYNNQKMDLLQLSGVKQNNTEANSQVSNSSESVGTLDGKTAANSKFDDE